MVGGALGDEPDIEQLESELFETRSGWSCSTSTRSTQDERQWRDRHVGSAREAAKILA
jgi:hypothetical protein